MGKLLIDFLDETSAYLHVKRDALKKLELQYRKIYDPDIVREMKVIRGEISKKRTEIRAQLLLNLEEFRALHKYFPELLSAFMEDEYIGKVLRDKAWLLDYKMAPPKVAAAKLDEIRGWRMQLRAAKESLRGWIGVVHADAFVSRYPLLRAHLRGDMMKQDVLNAISTLDDALRKEGWLVLITDSLIRIPLAKFMNRITELRYDELKAKSDLAKMRGKGTIAETRAQRALEAILVEKNHFESIVAQILLSNPGYLSGLKKQKSWLSKGKPDPIVRFAQQVTPHAIRERAWLDEMRKRIGGNK
jgi:hypothetical protein